jgi:predicted DNA-binding protein (MmcQ/YjbR family)
MDVTQAELLADWKQAYLFLDRNWASVFLGDFYTDDKILAIVHKAKQYVEYRKMVKSKGLNPGNATHVGLIDEIIKS